MTEGLKTVIVEVDANSLCDGQDDAYEITFENRCGKMTDLDIIWKKMQGKNEVLREFAKKCDVVFKRSSLFVEGRWVVIGDKSPVKNGTQIKCCLKPRLLFSSISSG